MLQPATCGGSKRRGPGSTPYGAWHLDHSAAQFQAAAGCQPKAKSVGRNLPASTRAFTGAQSHRSVHSFCFAVLSSRLPLTSGLWAAPEVNYNANLALSEVRHECFWASGTDSQIRCFKQLVCCMLICVLDVVQLRCLQGSFWLVLP